MQITVHDSGMRKVAFIDNNKQGTLNFYNDKWTRILGAFGSTFEFTVFKKSVKSDLLFEKAYHHLNDRSFISFEYKGKTQLFSTLKTEEDEETIRLYCESPTLELLNEYCGPYTADQAYTFLEYCEMWGILNLSAINVGINEIKTKELTLEWTSEDTKLKRLLSLANNFGVELELETQLNYDSSLDQFIINIYRANNGDDIQGLGQRRADIMLEYGKNINRITRKVDKSNLVNAIKPRGKKQVTTKVYKTVPKERTVVLNAKSVRKWNGGTITYAGHKISSAVVQQILDLCISYRVLPSGVISQLYLESNWGDTPVGRADNNWGGMSGTAQTRPSGVVVTTGLARPANEGGTYFHYKSVSDFIKDYMFLLAEQKTSSGAKMYGVKGKTNISDYTKGLFRVGGALYDYAAAGYASYARLMTDIRSGINRQTKGSMDTLDKLFMQGGTTSSGAPRTTISKKATQTESALNKVKALKGQRVGSGQCYALSAYYANVLGGPGLGGGVTGLRGLKSGGIRACNIGEDYYWSNYGWSYVKPTNVSQLKAGGIANIKPNLSYLGTGYYGHTVIIKSVTPQTITVYEQNYNGKQYVVENSYSTKAYLGAIQSVVYPKEITQGAIVGGIATTTNDDGTVTTTEYYSETTVEEVTETVDLFIDDSNKQKWLTEDGELEFYIKNGMLFAPISKQMYPSVLSGTETNDNWIRRDIEVDTDKESVLISTALRELRKNAYPAITYELDGWFDGDIGDSIDIRDTGFVPTLLLNARIFKQEISFTQPETNKTEFANFKELENMISSGLMSDWERLAEQAKPYDLHLATDNGTTFKNNTGSSLLSATLMKSGAEINDAIIFYKVNDAIVGSGPSLVVNATDFDKSWNITVEAYLNEQLVASRQITFTDVEDGKEGPQGPKGADGVAGKDGKSSYLHTAYANKSKGIYYDVLPNFAKPLAYQNAVVTSTPENGAYKISSTGGSHVMKAYFGVNGTSGKELWAVVRLRNTHTTNNLRLVFNGFGDGSVANGSFPTIIIPPQTDYVFLDKGVARSNYDFIQITFQADTADKDLSFTVYEACFYNSAPFINFSTVPTNQSYTGTYTDNSPEASNDIAKYKWYLTKGDSGADGKSSWFAYANSADGKTDFSTTDGSNRRYIGTYIGYTRSNLYSDYTWTDVTANTKSGNRNLLINTKTLSSNINSSANSTDTYNGGTVAKSIAASGSYKDTFRQKMSVVPDELDYIVSFYAKSSAASHNMTCYFYAPSTTIKSVSSQGVVNDKPAGSDGATNITVTNEWKRYWIKWLLRAPKDDTEKIPKEVIIGRTWDSVNTLEIALPALYAGNLNTEWSLALEDIQSAIDSKADDALTTEQLQALADAQRIAEADLKGKADIATVEAWVQALKDEIEARKAGQATSEQALIDASNRVIAIQQSLGDMQARTDFINTYMSKSENGLIIGMKDGSSSVRVSNDRISFYSAGKETAYITQGILQIESGIFTSKLQIGRFRIEQYNANLDMNVCRYIG